MLQPTTTRPFSTDSVKSLHPTSYSWTHLDRPTSTFGSPPPCLHFVIDSMTQVPDGFGLRDVEMHSWSCLEGWATQGLGSGGSGVAERGSGDGGSYTSGGPAGEVLVVCRSNEEDVIAVRKLLVCSTACIPPCFGCDTMMTTHVPAHGLSVRDLDKESCERLQARCHVRCRHPHPTNRFFPMTGRCDPGIGCHVFYFSRYWCSWNCCHNCRGNDVYEASSRLLLRCCEIAAAAAPDLFSRTAGR